MVDNIQHRPTQHKPIICTFLQLAYSMQSLHMWQKERVSELHDIWMKGAPTPQSRILNPKGYDPRKVQAGNVEQRIVFPNLLLKWVRERASAMGVQIQDEQALFLVSRVGSILAGDLTERIDKQ